MFFMSVMFFSLSMFLIIFFNILLLTSNHKKKDREKSSPFECGFDPFNNARLAFSIHFFLIMIMFLIFDVEIAIITPSIFMMNLPFTEWMYILLSLILILIMGLIMEWKEGCMNWK